MTNQFNDGGGQVRLFNDLGLFSQAVRDTGVTLDFLTLVSLGSNFLEASEQYLVLCIKLFDVPEPNLLAYLTEGKVFLYAKSPPSRESMLQWTRLKNRRYGESTAVAFYVLRAGIANYKARLDVLVERMKDLEQTFDAQRYRELSNEFGRLFDRLEDFHDILIKLEQTDLRQVETRYISFDYRVLMAESSNLLDRSKRRVEMLKDIARDHELQTASELNRRIERLNEVVKRLTALTILLMIPNLIASHFGMNFAYMPELRLPWAYPVVIVVQVLLMIAGVVLFRRIGWL